MSRRRAGGELARRAGGVKAFELTLDRAQPLPVGPLGQGVAQAPAAAERRERVPVGWLEPPTIPSDLVRVLKNATLADFALPPSAIHMASIRQISGRLKSDDRHSIGVEKPKRRR